MPALTPTFVMDLESRMRKITENEYLRLTASEHMWWQKITRVIPSGARREIITWILNTAQLQDQGQGGNIAFDDMSILETEFVPKTAGKGLKIRRQQFEDLDGNGVQLASEWSSQMGAQHGYWPQKSIATLLKAGETTTAYDGKNYFATDHLNDPNAGTAAGSYSNLLTSVDISTAVATDVALANLASVYNSIASLKMPNGSDPRYLRPAGILVPPKMFPRAVQLTSAKFLAQVAGSGAAQGGSGDVSGLIASMGFGMPTQVDELIGFESDTTYFVYAEQIAGSQLGAFAYVDREPFTIRYYTGRGGGNGVDAILDRADVLEWHTSGRNVAAPGHPFMLFKCKP